MRTRPRIRHTPPGVRAVLDIAATSKQREAALFLLQRYGVKRTADLLPEQVEEFTAELQAVLQGTAPHPADSIIKA